MDNQDMNREPDKASQDKADFEHNAPKEETETKDMRQEAIIGEVEEMEKRNWEFLEAQKQDMIKKGYDPKKIEQYVAEYERKIKKRHERSRKTLGVEKPTKAQSEVIPPIFEQQNPESAAPEAIAEKSAARPAPEIKPEDNKNILQEEKGKDINPKEAGQNRPPKVEEEYRTEEILPDALESEDSEKEGSVTKPVERSENSSQKPPEVPEEYKIEKVGRSKKDTKKVVQIKAELLDDNGNPISDIEAWRVEKHDQPLNEPSTETSVSEDEVIGPEGEPALPEKETSISSETVVSAVDKNAQRKAGNLKANRAGD